MPTDTLEPVSARLLRGYRVMRGVAPPEAPWPGLLVRTPDDGLQVLVDADLLGEDWAGWDAAASGHLLTPLDVVRRADGHDAALPVCTERVDAFLARRRDAGAPVSDGEALTLAVSFLRAAAECADAALAEPAGTWWLTDDGRPVLATGVGEPSGSTAAVLGELRAQAAGDVRHAIDDVLGSLSEPRTLARDLDMLEAALFASGEPAPLATTMLGPQRARSLASGAADAWEDDLPPRRTRWADLVAAHVDADIADAASQAVTSVWRRLRVRRPGRRAPWVLAGALAVAVLGVGLLWPTGDPAPAAETVREPPPPSGPGDHPVDTDAAVGGASDAADADDAGREGGDVPGAEESDAAPAPSPGPAPVAPAPGGDSPGEAAEEWVGAAEGVLAARASCGADAACLAAVVEDPARVFPPGAIDHAPGERTITLLDDYGGAAVLRVDPVPPGPPSQLVVLVRRDGEALLRDVHDVAEQGG